MHPTLVDMASRAMANEKPAKKNWVKKSAPQARGAARKVKDTAGLPTGAAKRKMYSHPSSSKMD